jgi:hypothetical protein
MDTGAREKDPQSDLKDANGGIIGDTSALSFKRMHRQKVFVKKDMGPLARPSM